MSKSTQLYGIPHCHSSHSTGDSSPKEIFKTCSKHKMDFIIITDHNSHIDSSVWEKNKIIAESFKKTNCICLLGLECNSFLGHINIYNSSFTDLYFKDIESLSNFKKENPMSIISINHPNKKLLKLKYIKTLDDSIDLIEVGNGTKKYKDYEHIYNYLLCLGYKLGAINSQDNHRLNMVKYTNTTGVFCKKKNSFISSLLSKHCISTGSNTINLKFLIDNKLFGSTLPYKPNYSIEFSVSDKKNPIKSIQLISNKGIVYEKSFKPSKKIYEKFSQENSDFSFLYLKVIQENKSSTITSPFFICNKLNL